MNPRFLLRVVAITYGFAGVALLFTPLEVAPWLGFASGSDMEGPLQLFSAGLLGFGMLNWMGRGAIYGGIYGRPIAVANFGFAAVVSPTLVRAQLASGGSPLGWAFAGLVTLIWLAYGSLLWSKPWFPDEPADSSDD